MILNIEINGQLLHVEVVKRKGTKSVRLAWRDHQKLRLTLPWHARLKDGEKFLESAKPWMAKKLGERKARIPFTHGATLPVLGQDYVLQIEVCRHEKVSTQGNYLHIQSPENRVQELVYQFLKDELADFCLERCKKYAEQLGAPAPSVKVKNMNTRWGSCSSSGNIALAWRLVFLPTNIIHYVCAHEAAHLIVMNHSQAFWGKVMDIYPEYGQARKWLRMHGKNAHQYG